MGKALKVKKLVYDCVDYQGFIREDVDQEKLEELNKLWKTVIKWGISESDHDTLVRFTDITFITEGLHKAGQGDLDAHAMNVFNNRVVRSSTRLAFEKFKPFEKSPFYQDKIIHYGELEKMEIVNFPNEINNENGKYINTGYGYIHENIYNLDEKDYQQKGLKNDYMRGMLTLDSPNNAIWKANLWGIRYMFYRRDIHTTATPELKKVCRDIKEDLMNRMPIIGEIIDKRFVFDEKTFVHMGNAMWVSK